jgi:hypothetical protein
MKMPQANFSDREFLAGQGTPIKFVPPPKVPPQRSRANGSRPSCALRHTIAPGRFAAARRMTVVHRAVIL